MAETTQSPDFLAAVRSPDRVDDAPRIARALAEFGVRRALEDFAPGELRGPGDGPFNQLSRLTWTVSWGRGEITFRLGALDFMESFEREPATWTLPLSDAFEVDGKSGAFGVDQGAIVRAFAAAYPGPENRGTYLCSAHDASLSLHKRRGTE